MESELLTFQKVSRQIRIEQTVPLSSKRLFDVLFSLAVLICLAPLFLAITVAIRISSGGGAFYVQPRLGRGGRLFPCYKFRTMYPQAEKKLAEILARNPLLKAEWLESQKLKEDPRVFPIGRWLRKTSLDELPQFWNVLRGDLSVVGPRPYMVKQKMQMGALAPKILSIKPGITGLWQTSGRSRTTFAQRVALDASYVSQRSFWLDIKLIIKTVPQLFFPKDAC